MPWEPPSRTAGARGGAGRAPCERRAQEGAVVIYLAEQSQGCRAPTPVSIAPTASTPGRRNHQRANRRQRRGCLRAADGSRPGRSPSPPPSSPPSKTNHKKKRKIKRENEQPSPQTPFLLLRYPPKGCGLGEAGPSHGGAPIAARPGLRAQPRAELGTSWKISLPL